MSHSVGWILGDVRKDLLFIFLPGLIGMVLSFLLPFDSVTFMVFAFFTAVIVDSGHVYTTAWRTFFRKEEVVSHPIYWVTPLAVIFGIFLWLKLKIPYVWSFVVYATVYHHMTQFYGFLRWYQKLNKKTSVTDAYFLFALMIVPFILVHFRTLPSGGIYTEQDIFFYPDAGLFRAGLVLYAVLVTTWLGYEWSLTRKGPFEVNRFLAILGPALLYGYCFLLGRNLVQVISPLLLSHGIPYMAVMSWSMPKLDLERFRTVRKALIIIAATAVIGGLADYAYENNLIPISNDYASDGISVLKALLTGFYLVPLLCHYIFDGFIWKSKHRDAGLIYSNPPAA